MFIIDDVISWIVGKIMDKFFSNKKENEELIQLRNERIRLNQKIDQLEGEKETKEQEKKKFIDSLKRRGISADKLILPYHKWWGFSKDLA